MTLTDEQLSEFNRIFQIFGYSGSKSTLCNHCLIYTYIQTASDEEAIDPMDEFILMTMHGSDQKGKLWLKSYGLSQECVDAVCLILNRKTIKLKI